MIVLTSTDEETVDYDALEKLLARIKEKCPILFGLILAERVRLYLYPGGLYDWAGFEGLASDGRWVGLGDSDRLDDTESYLAACPNPEDW